MDVVRQILLQMLEELYRQLVLGLPPRQLVDQIAAAPIPPSPAQPAVQPQPPPPPDVHVHVHLHFERRRRSRSWSPPRPDRRQGRRRRCRSLGSLSLIICNDFSKQVWLTELLLIDM